MAELATVARPYAEALFRVAQTGDMAAWSDLVSQLAQVGANPDVQAFAANPKLSATDLVATLPRQIGETLARTSGLVVFDCPVPVPPFTVKQHWHARYHQEPGNRWLRGLCVSLFEQGPGRRPDAA